MRISGWLRTFFAEGLLPLYSHQGLNRVKQSLFGAMPSLSDGSHVISFDLSHVTILIGAMSRLYILEQRHPYFVLERHVILFSCVVPRSARKITRRLLMHYCQTEIFLLMRQSEGLKGGLPGATERQASLPEGDIEMWGRYYSAGFCPVARISCFNLSRA